MTLIEILKRVSSVMEQVAEMKKPLDMHYWYQEPELAANGKTIHTCNTPACAAGWAALDPDLREVIEEFVADHYATLYDIDSDGDLHDPDAYPINLRRLVTYKFSRAYTRNPGANLGFAIFGADPSERRRTFRACFPNDDAEQFNHLTEDFPTPEDVIELLTFIVKHLETSNAN